MTPLYCLEIYKDDDDWHYVGRYSRHDTSLEAAIWTKKGYDVRRCPEDQVGVDAEEYWDGETWGDTESR